MTYINRAYLSQHKQYLIESASEVTYGQNGNTLVIDNGKKTVLVLDENDRLIQRYVLHFSVDDPAAADVFSATETLLFKLAASPDGRRALVTDQVGFYRFDEAGESEYIDEVEVAYFRRILLTWATLILGLLALALPLLKLVGLLAGAAGRSDNALRVLLIVLASLSVASVLLSIGGWRGIYSVGAAILAAAWGLSITSGNVTPGRSELDISMERHTTFAKFMRSRRVIGFFALMLVPFMMALSYREYFFPLYAQESGIQEVRIGQIYLVCGMMVIYIGPALSGWLLKKFHALWSVVIASAAMGLNMLLFVLFPSLATVILGVVILSVIISFAYTCQYTYFEMTPESLAYGQGRSMGVYSVFESLGQTVGPIVYGTLLTLGYRSGIAIFCIAMVVFTALFAFVMRKDSMLYE